MMLCIHTFNMLIILYCYVTVLIFDLKVPSRLRGIKYQGKKTLMPVSEVRYVWLELHVVTCAVTVAKFQPSSYCCELRKDQIPYVGRSLLLPPLG